MESHTPSTPTVNKQLEEGRTTKANSLVKALNNVTLRTAKMSLQNEIIYLMPCPKVNVLTLN
jgi:hypothetical protein